MTHFYDVALSFSGEDRVIARQIADSLRKRGVSVFFEENIESGLWGRHLFDYLTKIYQESRLCIAIVSDSYARGKWTSSELRNLVAHSLLRDSFTILPVAVGLTRADLPEKLSYIDWSKTNADEVAALAEKRLQSLPQPSNKPEAVIYHVIVRKSGWVLKRAGASRATSLHKTQEDAIAAARKIAGKNGSIELVIHRKDGTIASREVLQLEDPYVDSDNRI